MKQLIIDRFEEEWAICEYREGETIRIPREALPADSCEGDVLMISKAEKETEDRKAYADTLRNKLFGRS